MPAAPAPPILGAMQKRILICRQDRLGDVVLATALPREIKRRWPDAYVGVLVRGYTRELFAHDPHVDAVLTDDFRPATRWPSFWARVGELRRHRFTHGLMALADARMAYLLAAAGIPRRYGHGITLYHALSLTRPVMSRKLRKGQHESAYSMDLVRVLGVEPEDTDPRLFLSEREREAVEHCRSEWGAPGRRIVGLQTTSGASAPNWEPARWAELARLLTKDPRLQVMITDMAPPPVVDGLEGVLYPLRGLGIRPTMVRLAALDVLVATSTGPLHMAAALGVPTVSLYCPLPSSEPALWGPLGSEGITVLPEPGFCRDRCPGDPHVCTYAGSRQASPTHVAAEVARLFLEMENPPA
ncbi:MAG: glycosyltransferase family 9 protein [bacterium]|nr:glycosyltransferase family 9 protein [bacterium]